MSKVDIKTLFEAGAHFGHKTSRWHPAMKPFIHSSRGNIHIINLEKTVELLAVAEEFIRQTAASGKTVLFVGTKRQAQTLVANSAKDCDMPYVSVRWFGGMLTNFKTIQQRVKRLKDLESRMASGELANRYSKLEVQRFGEEIQRLNHNFGGIKEMSGLPGAVIVFDAVNDDTAIKEANKLKIPVVAVVDTNADPRLVDYPIPANDDAIKTLRLVAERMVEAVKTGKAEAKAAPAKEPKPAKAKEAA